MPTINVLFEYLVGLREHGFTNALLVGNWDAQGRKTANWQERPMERFTAEDGCVAFRAAVSFDDSQLNESFSWGVRLRSEAQANPSWGIATEVNEASNDACNRVFRLTNGLPAQRYYLTHCRRLGANKFWQNGQLAGVRFAVWAPNATLVQLVRGDVDSGYIFSDGTGVAATIAMRRDPDGVWYCDPTLDDRLADYAEFEHTPYMYRITRGGDASGVKYRTDLYSRCQIGSGRCNPENPRTPVWNGRRQDLDGTKSCSVVVDPEQVVRVFRQADSMVFPETDWVGVEQFWEDEFVPERPLPTKLEDLVIYELHVDGLGVGRDPADRGRLEDALALLDYLVDLGVNCIELLPFAEYEGWANWGYATSHYAAIEYAGGGRDQFKHFVKQCHRRGIAVIFDVVYNHYTPDGERAEWMYDAVEHEQNIYYWYEGRPSDYPGFDNARPDQRGHGGYVDNMSTGYAPRYSEEMVRKLFISSAVALVNEFHVDGFRVDQTTSIHAYAALHADGRAASTARAFGGKFLRELTRTLTLVKPNVFLIAEDHSGWDAVTKPTTEGGLGFQAVWYSEYYHHLIGDAQNDSSRARLLKYAGFGDNRELHMSWFAGALANASAGRVIYHESHDEAGNSYYQENGQDVHSARTIVVAVNGAELTGETRRWAEARTRVVAGITLMAPGTPMFFMGEEVGAWEPYRYADFLNHRQDFEALRQGVGANLFRFYSSALRLRAARSSVRTRDIEIVHVHDANRIVAFLRRGAGEATLVIASLNNGGFDGYRIQSRALGGGPWKVLLNSDDQQFGGWGRAGSIVAAGDGYVDIRLSSNNLVVLGT